MRCRSGGCLRSASFAEGAKAERVERRAEDGMVSLRQYLSTRAPAAAILVRIMVGSVFLSEGIQKFLYAAALGAGRFTRIGIPASDVIAPIVGTFEITCGLFVLLGLGTRLASVPLIAIMTVAITTTKVPILLKSGFWSMAHEARTDWSMLLGAVFLLVVGAGPWSFDARLAKRGMSRD